MSELFEHPVISVSELNAIAKNMLEPHFYGVWIGGEISNLTRASSGHYYFSLKDSLAQVRCVLFKFAAERLTAPLKEGEHIEVCGKVSIYEARGEFQITVNEVRQKGLGQLFARYERLKQQLHNEGLFSSERKKPLPKYPKKVGIITSLAAAALRDVCSAFRRRAPHIELIVYPTSVQGQGSEQSIAQAIALANQRHEVDLLIVCRGGGSIEDLWAFNEEISVRAVADSRLPIISGIGHETDFTLCDFVADVRAATPTAAAELASASALDLMNKLDSFQAACVRLLQQTYQNASQKVDFYQRSLIHPKEKLNQQKQQVGKNFERLNDVFRQLIQQRQQSIWQSQQLLQHRLPNIQWATQKLQSAKQVLTQEAEHWIRMKQEQLARQTTILDALAPQHILQRGYAMVQNHQGQIIDDPNRVKTGQKLLLTLAKGQLDVQVLAEQGQKDLF